MYGDKPNVSEGDVGESKKIEGINSALDGDIFCNLVPWF